MHANPFPYANDHQRYNTWNCRFRQTFEQNVFKAALDGGFDCPNGNGAMAYGGCTFCRAAGPGDVAGSRTDDLAIPLLNALDAEFERCDHYQGKRDKEEVAAG